MAALESLESDELASRSPVLVSVRFDRARQKFVSLRSLRFRQRRAALWALRAGVGELDSQELGAMRAMERGNCG